MGNNVYKLLGKCAGKWCHVHFVFIVSLNNSTFVSKTEGTFMTLLENVEPDSNSLEKWLHNTISKQTKETCMSYRAGTQYTQQSLNEKQHAWLCGR